MVTEIDSEHDLPETINETDSHDGSAEYAPFPMLSRDRLIRRVISPRLWKHVTVAILLTLVPIIYAIATWPSPGTSDHPDHGLLMYRYHALRGLSGMKFFVAAQFCLIIAWVRSASAVDFRGRYRWWRWMAGGLFAASLTLITDSNQWMMNLTAEALEPLFGRIDAARPALIFVPAGAFLALLLRQLIPDMGRCRMSQSLLVVSIVLLVVRTFAGAREQSEVAMFHLSTLELLISGLMLSAFQLHARFVVHVNPNPPLAAKSKVAGNRVEKSQRINESRIAQQNEQIAVAPIIVAESSNFADASEEAISIDLQHPADEKSALHEADRNEPVSHSEAQSSGKSKHGKKAKFRKAG